jgi:hypothetical protein
LNERQQLQWSASFLDGSFAPAKKGALESGKAQLQTPDSGNSLIQNRCVWSLIVDIMPYIGYY